MGVLRSVLAVIAGFALVFILSIATDSVLEAIGFFPPVEEQTKSGLVQWALWVALGYRILYTIAGGTLTAWLAPRRPILHAVVLGGIGTVAALGGAIAMWNLGSQWYPILLVLVSVPCTWLGGVLARKKSL